MTAGCRILVGVFLTWAWGGYGHTEASEHNASIQTAAQLREAQELVRSSMLRYLGDGDTSAARQDLLAAIAKSPNYSPAIYDLALVSEADGNWTAAEQQLHQYLVINTNAAGNAVAQQELTRIAAVERLEQSPDGRNKRLYDERIFQAQVLVDLGMPHEAIEQAAIAVRLNAQRWEGYAAVAESLSRVRHYGQAEAFLRQSIAVSYGDKRKQLESVLATCQHERQYQYLTHQAAAELRAKHYVSAARAYESAWMLFPSREMSGLAFAITSAMAGDYQGSARVLNHLRDSLNPELSRRARTTLARLQVRRAVPATETAADAEGASGLRYASQGDFEAAQAAYQSAAQEEPGNPTWHAQLAAILAKRMDWARAATEYRRAYLLDPSDENSLSNLGAVLLQAQRYDEAEGVYAIAIQHQPTNALHYDHLGTALYLAHKPKDALAQYQHAVKLEPSNGTYQSHLAAASRAP